MKSAINITIALCLAALTLLATPAAGHANTRTLESRFDLSADQRSEYRAQFPAPSAGQIVIEATWAAKAPAAPPRLTLILLYPDGTEAARRADASPLILRYRATEQEVERFSRNSRAKWTAKVINDADAKRHEVTGKLRVTVPVTGRTLADTTFTLLGGGNAQEIPVLIPAPGRLTVDAQWEADAPGATPPALVVSLIHPGKGRTCARRPGPSPVHVECLADERDLDSGNRWLVRIQNDGQVRVKGRLKVVLQPGL